MVLVEHQNDPGNSFLIIFLEHWLSLQIVDSGILLLEILHNQVPIVLHWPLIYEKVSPFVSIRGVVARVSASLRLEPILENVINNTHYVILVLLCWVFQRSLEIVEQELAL